MDINMKFHTDWMQDFSPYILADLLEGGINTLIYAGDVDFICNYLGNQAWTYGLKWSGGDDFRAATVHAWKGAGLARVGGPLTFLQVYDAGKCIIYFSQSSDMRRLFTHLFSSFSGHMVPADQPKTALDMITTFINGESF